MAKPKLKTVVDSLDDVAEELHFLYEEGAGRFEGKYVMGGDAIESVDGYEVADVKDLDSALKKERQAKRRTGGNREKLQQDYDAAQERIEELQSQIEGLQAGGGDGGKPADADAVELAVQRATKKLRAEMEATQRELTEQVEALTGERDTLRERAQNGDLNMALSSAFDATDDGERYVPRSRKAAERVLRDFLKFEQDDEGNEVLRILDPNGDGSTPLAGSAKGGVRSDPTPRDLLRAIAKNQDFADLFTVEAPSGSGAAQSRRGPNAPVSNGRRRVVTPEEQADFATWKAIKDQAAQDGTELVYPEATGA